LADIVAKGFLASERATLIQDQALMRNVDSKIHSSGFVCCAFLLYDRSVATFATISALNGGSLRCSNPEAFGVKRTWGGRARA
jgi:hypothetical protein